MQQRLCTSRCHATTGPREGKWKLLAEYANRSTLTAYEVETAIAMPTRNVVLTEQQAVLVEALVRSGRYQNASEVLRDGLRLLQRREEEDEAKLQALRAALDEAEAAVTAGDLSDYSPSLLEEIAGEESGLDR